MKAYYKEEQKFNQLWLWILLIGILLIPVAIMLYAYFNKPDGSLQLENSGALFIQLGISAALILFFKIMKLTTEIDDKSIHMQFYPFTKKTIFWNEIANVKVINYGFVGGWGIRFSAKYGTVYNVKGNKGLLVTLKSGKQFVIGTQQEDKLKRLVEKMNTTE